MALCNCSYVGGKEDRIIEQKESKSIIRKILARKKYILQYKLATYVVARQYIGKYWVSSAQDISRSSVLLEEIPFCFCFSFWTRFPKYFCVALFA